MTQRLILDSYARESRRGDKRRLSVTGQHASNEQRINDLGGVLGKHLDDQGKSAWNPDVTRGDWEELIARLTSRQCDGVVIFDLERFVRQVKDAVRIVDLAKVGFRIFDSDMEFDLTTTSGRDAFYKQAVAAETYSSRLSEKVSRGNRQRALNGEGKRGRYRAFGFEDDSTTVREVERPYIREVARMILRDGKTWPDAVKYLTKNGLFSTAIRHTAECAEAKESMTPYQLRSYSCECAGQPWSNTTLQQALKSPRMAGYARLGSELLGRLPGEPILDPADWQELCALISSRRGRPPAQIFLCTGKVPVRCWNCGTVLTQRQSSHGKRYPDTGEVKRYYLCDKTADGCGRTIADRYVLDGHVRDLVVRELSSTESADELKRQRERRQDMRAPHEKEIARLVRIRDHWDRQLNDGAEDMTIERHSFLTGDLNKKIKERNAKLEEIGEALSAIPEAESREAVLTKWEAAGPEDQRAMFRQAFGERVIYIQPGSSLDDDCLDRMLPAPRQSQPG
ncbi:recombinase family protein [Streptomyces sp. OK228]|uniref:recombinase family protein n=1 Tax=Streptomyces sp. OK228 TaxID=1882786 RepID=UPI000BDA4392|nr:recombinase family protein [Streptomyces sp. OK228]SOE25582.1 Site-specific DNA recombinase [Streptomyces sp. OK228]